MWCVSKAHMASPWWVVGQVSGNFENLLFFRAGTQSSVLILDLNELIYSPRP